MIRLLLKPIQWMDAWIFPNYTDWQLEEIVTVDARKYDPEHDLHVLDVNHAKRIHTVKYGMFSRINKKNNKKQLKRFALTHEHIDQ